jgi:retron-type reverse transcriptase
MEISAIDTHQEKFLRALRSINEKADVDSDTIDLLEAYSRMRLEAGKDIDFYSQIGVKKQQALVEILEKNDGLSEESINLLTAYFHEMRKKGHVCVLNTNHLANLLGCPPEELIRLARGASRNYTEHYISKRNGAKRQLLSPGHDLKAIQRKVLDTLLGKVPVSNHAEGFRNNRSIVTNAQRHTGKKLIVKLDVSDFFPSISSIRVKGAFDSLGYPDKVSKLLTMLTTYNGHLPIGAPTSPAISNIICRRLDKRFANLGKKMVFSYSRYADDITVSSDNHRLPSLIPLFKEVLLSEGFEPNESKIKVVRDTRRQEVTGVVVNSHMNIARNEIKRLRAVLHNCRRNGLAAEAGKWAREVKMLPGTARYSEGDFRRSLLAKINHVKMVNPHAGERLLESFRKIA